MKKLLFILMMLAFTAGLIPSGDAAVVFSPAARSSGAKSHSVTVGHVRTVHANSRKEKKHKKHKRHHKKKKHHKKKS
ncbi:MAG: hypothetical protein ACR2H1_10155 [Limisphaerales bacterium]